LTFKATSQSSFSIAKQLLKGNTLYHCSHQNIQLQCANGGNLMLKPELKKTTLPREIGAVLDFAPIDQAGHSEWVLLAEDGSLIRLDADNLAWKRVASSVLLPEPDHEPWNNQHLREHLHVSDCGRFAAVVNDYGKRGLVIDLQRGIVTRVLNGGDYYPDTVPFSFAFVNVNGQARCIHRTDWNRLDISDPATGELLSERSPTQYKEGEPRPPHYLDYFHGALYVSPNGTYILSDGWVWHPAGIPTIWNAENWCLSNTWESEDGSSKLDVCTREYYWGQAACWIDEKRLAIGGIGDDDEKMINGARIFDVTLPGTVSPARRSPLEIATIQGPAGLFFSDGASLFSADSAGLSRWDIAGSVRTGHIMGFSPTRHHRGARELAQLIDGTLMRWFISD
jgi:hypothetical protein